MAVQPHPPPNPSLSRGRVRRFQTDGLIRFPESPRTFRKPALSRWALARLFGTGAPARVAGSESRDFPDSVLFLSLLTGFSLQATVCTRVCPGEVCGIVAFPIRHPPSSWREDPFHLKGRLSPLPLVGEGLLHSSRPERDLPGGNTPSP